MRSPERTTHRVSASPDAQSEGPHVEVRIDVDALAARLKRPQTIAALADLLLRAAGWRGKPGDDEDF